MSEDEGLPIECPYCPQGNKKEFYNAQGVDSHFTFTEGHPTHNTEPIKNRIQDAQEQERDKVPPEDDIIEQWAENNYPQKRYWQEVPVQTPTLRSNTKRIDVVLFEDWPFPSEQVFKTKMRLHGMSKRSDEKRKIESILSEFEQETIEVRIFEAKRKLNFKSIGQILAYSEFFPEHYKHIADIEVVEKGIIYGQEDEMCFKTAERYGISPHPVNW